MTGGTAIIRRDGQREQQPLIGEPDARREVLNLTARLFLKVAVVNCSAEMMPLFSQRGDWEEDRGLI